jgi:hypothetical protein
MRRCGKFGSVMDNLIGLHGEVCQKQCNAARARIQIGAERTLDYGLSSSTGGVGCRTDPIAALTGENRVTTQA